MRGTGYDHPIPTLVPRTVVSFGNKHNGPADILSGGVGRSHRVLFIKAAVSKSIFRTFFDTPYALWYDST